MTRADIDTERRLLAQLSKAIQWQDQGLAGPTEVKRARSELIEFYRALGMHP
jgi:hypothetical protein